MAAPGGYIVREAFHAWWMKPILLILILLTFPWLIWKYYETRQAKLKCNKLLLQLSKRHQAFHLLRIKQRVTDCFQRLHQAWELEDITEAAAWMTPWYWQNQQMTALNKWQKKGLRNICRLRGDISIHPIYVSVNEHDDNWEKSILVVKIRGEIEDYLVDIKTGEIKEGQKGFVDYSSLWTFELSKGEWLLAQIAPGETIDEYLALPLEYPASLSPKMILKKGE